MNSNKVNRPGDKKKKGEDHEGGLSNCTWSPYWDDLQFPHTEDGITITISTVRDKFTFPLLMASQLFRTLAQQRDVQPTKGPSK